MRAPHAQQSNMHACLTSCDPRRRRRPRCAQWRSSDNRSAWRPRQPAPRRRRPRPLALALAPVQAQAPAPGPRHPQRTTTRRRHRLSRPRRTLPTHRRFPRTASASRSATGCTRAERSPRRAATTLSSRCSTPAATACPVGVLPAAGAVRHAWRAGEFFTAGLVHNIYLAKQARPHLSLGPSASRRAFTGTRLRQVFPKWRIRVMVGEDLKMEFLQVVTDLGAEVGAPVACASSACGRSDAHRLAGRAVSVPSRYMDGRHVLALLAR